MTEQDFERLLELGHETNGVEFKAQGKLRNPYLAGVIRAMLGMANRRDGGLVILGVEPDPLDPIGYDDDQIQEWLNYDELAARVNEFASPCVVFEPKPLAYSGRKFVIIRVDEFAEIPVLCCKDYHRTEKSKEPPILRRGACYVRSRHKPETSEIPSEEEMRELLELAIDKGVRRFVTRAQRAGLFQFPSTAPLPSDKDFFAKQIEEME